MSSVETGEATEQNKTQPVVPTWEERVPTFLKLQERARGRYEKLSQSLRKEIPELFGVTVRPVPELPKPTAPNESAVQPEAAAIDVGALTGAELLKFDFTSRLNQTEEIMIELEVVQQLPQAS